MNEYKIYKIIGHNFQSHKHTEVELDPFFNIIIGDTDRGKTSFFKRLTGWVLNNDLSGDYFVRDNDNGKVNKKGEIIKEDECYGTIIFTNGVQITRKKIKTKNIYELIDENGEVFEFENFGNKIPDKILEFIPTKTISIDKDLVLNLNFPPKKENNLIAATNGTKSKIIGSFAGTHIIDSAIRSIISDNLNNSRKEQELNKELLELDCKIKKYGDMEKKERLLNKGETLTSEIDTLEENKKKINEYNVSIINNNENIFNLNEIIKFKSLNLENEKYMKKLEKKVKEIEGFNKTFSILKDLIIQLNEKKINLKVQENIIKNKEKISKKEIEDIKKEIEISKNI